MAAEIDNGIRDMDEIEKALEKLHVHSEDTAQVNQAITILAVASKHDLATRKQLADPKVLRTLVEVVESSINDSLETTDLALRCIGNASIDNDDAREILTNIGFSWAIRCLRPSNSNDLKTPLLAAKVLYNICCDCEAAQRQCFDEHAHYELIDLCYFNSVAEGDETSLLIELLFWICGHKTPDSTTTNPLPENILSELMSLPGLYQDSLDTDQFAMLLETCLLFLRDAETQRNVIVGKQANQVLKMLQQNELRIIQAAGNEEDEQLLVPLSNSLIWCLSDMAAMPEFSQVYDLNTEWIRQEVIEAIWIARSGIPARTLTAACQILGNVLWSMRDPGGFVWLVEDRCLHSAVLGIITSFQDIELLNAAAGLLIQLSRPPSVREVIGRNEKAPIVLALLCTHETPQLKQVGIKLLRALGRDCPANQERFANLAREVMQSSPAEDTNMIEAPP
jgi:hypothetical protein